MVVARMYLLAIMENKRIGGEDVSINIGYLLSSAGLISDIGGALLLAKSVMMRSSKDIRKEGGTYFGSNVWIMRSAFLSKIEAQFAVPLLVLGFIGQLVGGYTESFQWATIEHGIEWTVALVVLSVIVVGFTYWTCILRLKKWDRLFHLYMDSQQSNARPSTETPPIETTDLKSQIMKYVNLHPIQDEPDAEFIQRARDTIMTELGMSDD